VLHANLILPYKGDLFSGKGRMWLAAQPLNDDERTTINGWLAELDRLAVDLGQVDAALARVGLGDDRVRRLMTITGINVTVAVGPLSAIGNITWFASSEKLVSYFGLKSPGSPVGGWKRSLRQLAALYHERWEIETALDELKTHLRGAKIVLRSKTPRPRKML
jgi:hypothetical protein